MPGARDTIFTFAMLQFLQQAVLDLEPTQADGVRLHNRYM